MIKTGSIVIDAGCSIKRNLDGTKTYLGDVDPECLDKVSHMNQVPGGIGPICVSYVMKNLIELH